jgi:hypothetical protein
MMTITAVTLLFVLALPGIDEPPTSEKITSKAKSLFDGKTLKGWKKTDFYKPGEVTIKDGCIRLAEGSPMTGVTWAGEKLPKVNYELSWEAMRESGNDFFCGVTFPVKDAPCSLIVAGWSGNITGLSSINGADASENETQRYVKIENNKWYKFRVRVDGQKLSAWIHDEQIVDFDYSDASLSVRIEVEASRPLGFASFRSVGLIRNIELKELGTTKNQ